MENFTSQPQLQIPTIPPGWCPPGATIREKLQFFIDTILSKSVINIPGLEEISLLDLVEIQQELTNLQNQYTALNKAERSITGVELITDGEVTINIVPNMPNADYNIMPIIISPVGSSAAGAYFAVTEVAGSKTTNSFKILCHNIPTDYTADFFLRQK